MEQTVVATHEERSGLRRSLDEIARPSLRLALWVPVFVAVTAAVGLAFLHGPFGAIRDADLRAVEWLVERRTDVLDTLTHAGTWLAETWPVLGLTILAAFLAWRATGALVLPAVIALAVGGEKLIYLLSSIIVGRDRPPVDTLGETFATASFPSGHVGAALTLYGSIALVVGCRTGRRGLRAALLVLAVVLTAIVAFARVYRGFHYPSDVVAGALMGAVWLWLTWRILGPARARR